MRALILCSLTAALIAAPAALADEVGPLPPVTDAPTLKECGECHMAFPAVMLPAASWRGIMAGLADRFGDDASLDPKLAAEIEAYLTRNAGRGNGQLLRITDQRWFRHEHDFPASVWTGPDVKSKVNCEACHRSTGSGNVAAGEGHGGRHQGDRGRGLREQDEDD
jgi:hypothetical protein